LGLKEILLNRKIGLLAIVGPAVALSAIAVSILLSPWFSFTDNALSDLGVRDVAPIFNFGLIFCGLLCSIFIASLFIKIAKPSLENLGVLFLLAACVFLICIGVFTEDFDNLHYSVSVGFFVTLLLSALILGFAWSAKKETRPLGIIGLIVVLIGIAGWSVSWGDGVAILELLSAVPACVWLFAIGLWSFKERHPY
jgi:hypothetical membrane protein